MENLSLISRALIFAADKGYKVQSGIVISPKGKQRKLKIDDGYFTFNIRPSWAINRIVYPVHVHRLVAFQKYGYKIFELGIVVRHFDGNSLNNLEDNIRIGTQTENALDRKPQDRLAHAIKASSFLRKFSDELINQIKEDRKSGMNYKELMKKYNISSLGTMSYIINNTYKTKI